MTVTLEYLQHTGSIMYGTSIALGLALWKLGAAHRGHFTHDSKRGVNIAQGDGIASKIIKKHPRYAKISPLVDHVIAAVGSCAGIGGIGGAAITAGAYADKTVQLQDVTLMTPYLLSAGLYVLLELGWEAKTAIKRKKIDIAQCVTDVTSSVLFLYAANAVSKLL